MEPDRHNVISGESARTDGRSGADRPKSDGDTHLLLRRARQSDIPTLQCWDRQPHVIAATCDDGEGLHIDWAGELALDSPWSEWLIAEEDGRAVGVMQIIDPALEETHYWGSCEANLRALDIWIGEASDLGRGLGTRMMGLALARCFEDPRVTAVLIDPLASNTRAHRFYKRLGFRFVERREFDGDDCFVFRLSREDWQAPG